MHLQNKPNVIFLYFQIDAHALKRAIIYSAHRQSNIISSRDLDGASSEIDK